ncbi:MAG TPA: hypothetical protein VL943_12685, partial [Niabella sp.]|nr:hypothetical protein [Niabella sp.]
YIPADLQYSSTDAGVIKRVSTSIVKNTKTNELIVRAVNLLPVNTNIRLNLDGVSGNQKAQKTVLNGNPADRKVKPVTSDVQLQANAPEVLPPYSLTVWRIKL